MDGTISIPAGWEAEVQDPNHHVYVKTGVTGGDRVHVVADIRDDSWHVQFEETGWFSADGKETLARKDGKQAALDRAAHYMRQH